MFRLVAVFLLGALVSWGLLQGENIFPAPNQKSTLHSEQLRSKHEQEKMFSHGRVEKIHNKLYNPKVRFFNQNTKTLGCKDCAPANINIGFIFYNHGYKTKDACEADRSEDKDTPYSIAADAAYKTCQKDYSCPSNCPEMRLGLPQQEICACQNRKTRKFLPPRGWWYVCEPNGHFSCCCVSDPE